MFDNDNEKIEMHDVYDQIWEKVNELSNTGSDTLVIAGTLMAQAVRIYKSVLEPEEVEKLLTHIVDNQDTIEPFKTRQLH
jgi:hypothetical protein|tara:strand:+ start:2875 stop:3114 length:240 start_codon:yes stop_codon:yes gene_type:complete